MSKEDKENLDAMKDAGELTEFEYLNLFYQDGILDKTAELIEEVKKSNSLLFMIKERLSRE